MQVLFNACMGYLPCKCENQAPVYIMNAKIHSKSKLWSDAGGKDGSVKFPLIMPEKLESGSFRMPLGAWLHCFNAQRASQLAQIVEAILSDISRALLSSLTLLQ